MNYNYVSQLESQIIDQIGLFLNLGFTNQIAFEEEISK